MKADGERGSKKVVVALLLCYRVGQITCGQRASPGTRQVQNPLILRKSGAVGQCWLEKSSELVGLSWASLAAALR